MGGYTSKCEKSQNHYTLMVIHDKEAALVEELPVNSEDEVAALGELPMVIHDKEVPALVEKLSVNS